MNRFSTRFVRLGFVILGASALTALGCSLVVDFEESEIPAEDTGVGETSADVAIDTFVPPDTAAETAVDSGVAETEGDTGAVDTGVVDTGADDTGAGDTGAVDTGVVDTGAVDTGAVDTGLVDTGLVDTGEVDTGVVDTGLVDTGLVDTGEVDTGLVDTGLVDTGLVDTGEVDTGVVDTGVEDTADAGDATAEDTSAATETFMTKMTGAQESPPVSTSASGTATCTLVVATGGLTCTINHDVTGAAAAHIHAGVFGVSGAALFPFDTATTGSTKTWTLNAMQIDDLRAGKYYINVHGTASAGGADTGQVRGQLIRAGETLLGARFAPVTTPDTGGGGIAFIISSDGTNVRYAGRAIDVVGTPNLAHIHDHATGGAVKPLTLSGAAAATTDLSGSFPSSDLGVGGVAALASGSTTTGHYVNVHSDTRPDGAVSGTVSQIFALP